MKFEVSLDTRKDRLKGNVEANMQISSKPLYFKYNWDFTQPRKTLSMEYERNGQRNTVSLEGTVKNENFNGIVKGEWDGARWEYSISGKFVVQPDFQDINLA